MRRSLQCQCQNPLRTRPATGDMSCTPQAVSGGWLSRTTLIICNHIALRLDELLGGGMSPTWLLEVSGVAAIGKTQVRLLASASPPLHKHKLNLVFAA